MMYRKNHFSAEFHQQICGVYRLNIMSDAKVNHWCCLCQEEGTNFYNEEHSGQSSLTMDDLIQKVENKVETITSLLTITQLSIKFSDL